MIYEQGKTSVTDREYQIGPNQVKLTQGNLVYIRAVGPQTQSMANDLINLYKQFYQEINMPMNFIIDLNEAGKNSPEARKAWKVVTEDILTSKVALVGIHPVARVLAGFVMSVTGRNKLQFFSTIDQAISWLSE
jgi:hypothetical protein